MRNGTIASIDATGSVHRDILVRETADGEIEYLVGDSATRKDGWATLPKDLHTEIVWSS